MDKHTTLDVRGLSCPQPALLAKQTLSQISSGSVEVLLDSATSRDNVRRIAQKAGWKVTEEQIADGFRLVLTK